MKFLILLMMASCAAPSFLMTQNDLLPYKESSQVTKLIQKTKSLKITSIEDKREVQDFGKAFTGVEYKVTPIHFDIGMNKLVNDYVVNALEMRNIIVTADGEMNMKIEVHDIWVEEVIEKFQAERAKCKMNLTFHINSKQSKWSGNFWTEFLSAGDLSDGSERLAPTLASCMNEIAEKLVTDKKFIKILTL